MIKVTETSIIIDRKALFEWVTGEAMRVKSEEGEVENVGTSEQVPTKEEKTDTTPKRDGINLFEKNHGIGGYLQDAKDGRKKIDELRAWLKKEKFSYSNFCKYLRDTTEVGGWKVSEPVIGLKADKEPSIFYLATRYYHYWKSQKDSIAKEYKKYLFNQVREMGYTVENAAKILEGEVIDPSELPKGTEVSA